MKNSHGGMLLSVKLQTSVSSFTKSKTPPCFFFFFKFFKWYQIAQRITYDVCKLHLFDKEKYWITLHRMYLHCFICYFHKKSGHSSWNKDKRNQLQSNIHLSISFRHNRRSICNFSKSWRSPTYQMQSTDESYLPTVFKFPPTQHFLDKNIWLNQFPPLTF